MYVLGAGWRQCLVADLKSTIVFVGVQAQYSFPQLCIHSKITCWVTIICFIFSLVPQTQYNFSIVGLYLPVVTQGRYGLRAELLFWVKLWGIEMQGNGWQWCGAQCEERVKKSWKGRGLGGTLERKHHRSLGLEGHMLDGVWYNFSLPLHITSSFKSSEKAKIKCSLRLPF